MSGVILVWVVGELITYARCETDLSNDDQSIEHGIAAKIGFPPTVLKVFIKGDIQPDEIEKLLKLCIAREEKVTNNDSGLKRERRNSISDYIGKLYSFNNLFRPYRGFKHVQTTRTPWLKKFLAVREEPTTESFWGMALGAHTFSPFARPLAQTRTPYYRIRNQQRIDRLLGITRNQRNFLAQREETNTHRLKNQQKFSSFAGFARNEEITTAMADGNQNATTREAFHKGPLDVAGLKTAVFSRMHPITTPRRLKFCEKQCEEEPEEARRRQPSEDDRSTGQPWQSSAGDKRTSSAGYQPSGDVQKATYSESETTGKCTCAACDDYLCDGVETERYCKPKRPIGYPRGIAVTKHVAHTKLATGKTTVKYTKSKDRDRPTARVWTLPPNAVLDQGRATTTEGPKKTAAAAEDVPNDKTDTGGTEQINGPGTTIEAPGVARSKSRGTCKHGQATKNMLCIPMPIPTRIRLPICPGHTKKCTRRCTQKTTTTPADDCTSLTPDDCECQSKLPPLDDVPISVGDSLDDSCNTPNEGRPQKIIVRISSALGEVPVVIMRDNGVSGVSLSLVHDYLLNENNKLIKCLGQKPLSGQMEQGILTTTISPQYLKKYRRRFPNVLRHQLHSLQPKRYSFKFHYDSNGLVSGPRASVSRTADSANPNPALTINTFPRSKLFPSYKLNSPITDQGSYGLQYQAIQNPGGYQPFKMEPPRLDALGVPMPQILRGFPGNGIGQTEYPRFKLHPGIAPGIEPSGDFRQPFLHQLGDTVQMSGYRSPFIPVPYPDKNDAQPPKYMIGVLQ